jgi:thiamine-monophosphate kinase
MKLQLSREGSILRKIAASARLSSKKAGTQASLPLGIGDDAALFAPLLGHETVLSCDWFLEGTHFLRDKHPPDSIGWKCLARAVSDVAAMGGVPRCCLLSLALPASLTGRWLDSFLGGLRRASRKFHCALAGGDTTRRDQILVNVTVVGEVRKGRALTRSGAHPGDVIYVSGGLGEAEWGLRLLKKGKARPNPKHPPMRKHLYPEPRLALGQWLVAKRIASAMMDLSDGLSSDLPRLCAASGVGARLLACQIPAAQLPARNHKGSADLLQLALHGGDDYELLFTVTPRRRNLVPRSLRGLPLTEIGVITLERQIVLVDENGRERSLSARGWDPFRTQTDLRA